MFQINQDRDDLRVKFCGLAETGQIQQSNDRSAAIDPKLYDEVFDGEVDCKTLESVYTLFNSDHPPFHRGHSLSVSDIVQITENKNNYLHGFFYCESVGFENIGFDPAQTQKPDDLLRVVAIEPGKPAYVAEVADQLRSFQQAVRGRIEVTYPFEGNAVAVSNAVSKLDGMPGNRTINGEVYAGTMFIVGDRGDGSFCSLTDEQTERYLAEFQKPEIFDDENMDFGFNMT